MSKTEKTFEITCYGKTEVFKESERKKMIKYYKEGVRCSDGFERNRYMNILDGLECGEVVIKDVSF